MGTGVNFPEVKQAGRDVDHTPPSSADVKNGVTLPIPLYAMMVWTGTTLPLPV